jgi:hypothetical protein
MFTSRLRKDSTHFMLERHFAAEQLWRLSQGHLASDAS